MKPPKSALIFITWIGEDNLMHSFKGDENKLEQAADLLGLMIGDITEEDLKS